MLRSPTRPPAPRVKASSTSPFDTFFRFLRDQEPAVPRSADSTGCQELYTVPCFVRSTYDDCTRPTHPGPGEKIRPGKSPQGTRRTPGSTPSIRQAGSSIQSGKQEAPSSQASRKLHPVRQAGNSIQERTVYVSLNNRSTDRSVEKKIRLGFLGIPRKKSDNRKFISVF